MTIGRKDGKTLSIIDFTLSNLGLNAGYRS